MERREILKHILEAYRCNPIPGQLEAAIDGIEELFVDCETQAVPLEERKRKFIESVRPYVEEIGKDTANDFTRYWLQITPKGRKFKFEKEKTWDIKLRLKTWVRNQRNFTAAGILEKKYARERQN